MAWFTRKKPSVAQQQGEKTVKTEGLWQKCPDCGQILWSKTLEENLEVCSKCGHHFRLDAMARLKMLFDGEFTEHDRGLRSADPLEFTDAKPYKDRLAAMRKRTGLPDAIVSATGLINGRKVEDDGVGEPSSRPPA